MVGILGKPRSACSFCQKPGHNQRTCRIKKCRELIAAHFTHRRNGEWQAVLEQVKTVGWQILGIGRERMRYLVSLVDQENPELVRRFFFLHQMTVMEWMERCNYTRKYGVLMRGIALTSQRTPVFSFLHIGRMRILHIWHMH